MIDEQILMQEAFKMAEKALEADEVPVGAIITYKNQIIARAHNQVELLKDPTAHAEMIAITQAASYLTSKWLEECSMYVTLEPCSMCAGALVLSRIKLLYFGARDPKTGACGSIYNIVQDERLNHRLEVFSGVLAKECGELLSNFFEKRRRF